MPQSWPVYVTHKQAQAYARWAGSRLPTEAEFHRAAFGTPQGDERAFPWGSETPAPRYGNFDFRRFDPEPVDAHPARHERLGGRRLDRQRLGMDLDAFRAAARFRADGIVPAISADFFDGKHYVMKGAAR